MEISMKGKSSKEMLGYYLQKSYDDAKAGKERGELVCWASSIAPCEFTETMGIHMLYPENHAAAVAARHSAEDLIQVSEQMGYSSDICSYARINLAYMKVQDCAAENMPLPDFVMVCNNICEVLIKWYENLAKELNVPVIMIDVPYNYEDQPTEQGLDYIAAQLESVIGQLEMITGKKFDYERYQEVMKMSLESSYWWKYANELASHIPSPLKGFDIFNYMALIVCMRGKAGCRDTFKKLAEELEEKVANGTAAFPDGEKHRIMWEGIAVWPYLGHTFKSLKNMGVNMTGSTYPVAWELQYTPNDYRSMAKAYTSVGNNLSLPMQIQNRIDVVTGYNCDGVTCHINRSCKNMSFMQVEMQKAVAEATGKPYIFFDGDQSDPGNFSPAQYDTRVQGLVEMMEQQKADANKGGI